MCVRVCVLFYVSSSLSCSLEMGVYKKPFIQPVRLEMRWEKTSQKQQQQHQRRQKAAGQMKRRVSRAEEIGWKEINQFWHSMEDAKCKLCRQCPRIHTHTHSHIRRRKKGERERARHASTTFDHNFSTNWSNDRDFTTRNMPWTVARRPCTRNSKR